jgi:hypothetical protein
MFWKKVASAPGKFATVIRAQSCRKAKLVRNPMHATYFHLNLAVWLDGKKMMEVDKLSLFNRFTCW